MMVQSDSYEKWVTATAVQFQESLKIYPKKRVQIRRVNIKRSQTILKYCNCLQWAWILWLLVFSVEVYNANILQTWLVVSSRLTFRTHKFILLTVVLHQHEHKESFKSIKKDEQWFYLSLTLVCPFSVLLLGRLTSGWYSADARGNKVNQPFIQCKPCTPTWWHTFNIWQSPAWSATGQQTPLMIILKLCQANRQERDANCSWSILPV